MSDPVLDALARLQTGQDAVLSEIGTIKGDLATVKDDLVRLRKVANDDLTKMTNAFENVAREMKAAQDRDAVMSATQDKTLDIVRGIMENLPGPAKPGDPKA